MKRFKSLDTSFNLVGFVFEEGWHSETEVEGDAEDEEVARRVEVDELQVRHAGRHHHRCRGNASFSSTYIHVI